ncbi:MAG: glycosyltransferase family 2 protein [Lachnospiraceae bacterium]|nr:glycosyltransferase family 2 protein [Lachnospiraceae bacterium]
MNDTASDVGIQFSVIIPHYNSPMLLKKLLLTIPEDNDIEVIVVDDRSDQYPEETEEVIRYIAERKNAVFLRNETGPKGAGTCRNLGMEKAKGQWLLFADADDFFVENAFQAIRESINQEADLLFFTPCSVYLDTGEPAERTGRYERLVRAYMKDSSDSNETLLRYQFTPPWSKVYRRSMIRDNHVLFEETLVSNDIMFSMRAAYCAKRIAASERQIYCVTRSSGSLTTVHNKEWLHIRAQVFVESYCFLKGCLDPAAFESLEMTGMKWIWEAILGKYGFSELLYILKLYKKNHVRILLPKHMNVFADIHMLLHKLFRRSRENKHQ